MEEQQPNLNSECSSGADELVDLREEEIERYAMESASRRHAAMSREGFDFDALKIFLILAGLTAAMGLAVWSVF
jgi:hypothetical protein